MSTESNAAAQVGLERCERLLTNADFQWFLEMALTKPRKDAEARLKDTKTDRDAREIAAHVREALETAETLLPRQRDTYARQIKK